jgi:hypothetical protein
MHRSSGELHDFSHRATSIDEIISVVETRCNAPMVKMNMAQKPYEAQFEFRGRGSLTEVSIRRYSHVPTCDVIVSSGDRQISIRCDDYDAAVKWAQVECKSYGIVSVIKVEKEVGEYPAGIGINAPPHRE